MTKKDFEAVAAIISREAIRNPAPGFDEGYDAGVENVALEIADYFASTNPRFDRARFLEACKT